MCAAAADRRTICFSKNVSRSRRPTYDFLPKMCAAAADQRTNSKFPKNREIQFFQKFQKINISNFVKMICVRMYVRTYVCTYVRMYVRTYVRMYVRTYVRTYVHTYLSLEKT